MRPDDERARLRAVFDRLVPADEWPSVADAGLEPYLDELDAHPLTRRDGDAIRAAVEAVTERSLARHGRPPEALEQAQVDELLEALPDAEREILVRAAARAYYGHAAGAGRTMLGFRPVPPGPDPTLRTTPLAEVADAYDVVVLGAGGGGGVAACVLAEAGASVLLVERGPARLDGPVDELRNHRTQAHGLGPASPVAEPRVVGGRARTVERPWDPDWHAGASVVGGGTRVYQGLAWRFLADDLRMASRYGVPDGSSLADWPLTADDLAPHYEWIEREVGVAGPSTVHPMRPLPEDREAALLRAGAERLGLATRRVPLLLNTVPRDGRPACGEEACGACVGLPCPTGGRNGTHDTVVPRALAAGATLVVRTRATQITTSGGRVDGVALVDEAAVGRRHVRAGHVVVACGAIETARLLLASRSDEHPDGLGNATDQVGRHLQGHAFASAFGWFDEDLDGLGPGATIATLDLAHGNVDGSGAALVGGGVVGNELRKLPVVHWQWALPPGAPRWGLAGKALVRDTFRRTGHLFAQVQEIPRAGNRVTLDPHVRDRHGVPAARLTGTAHPETTRTARHVVRRAEAWLAASGASHTWVDDAPTGLLAGTHQAGTCRMGADPATSVTDPDGRAHGHDNLWVADASLHVTNGSVGPALTVMALAHRVAERLLAGS
ncbi:MAG: GMC oxidoreductase [Acidimicrobiia bacterium]